MVRFLPCCLLALAAVPASAYINGDHEPILAASSSSGFQGVFFKPTTPQDVGTQQQQPSIVAPSSGGNIATTNTATTVAQSQTSNDVPSRTNVAQTTESSQQQVSGNIISFPASNGAGQSVGNSGSNTNNQDNNQNFGGGRVDLPSDQQGVFIMPPGGGTTNNGGSVNNNNNNNNSGNNGKPEQGGSQVPGNVITPSIGSGNGGGINRPIQGGNSNNARPGADSSQNGNQGGNSNNASPGMDSSQDGRNVGGFVRYTAPPKTDEPTSFPTLPPVMPVAPAPVAYYPQPAPTDAPRNNNNKHNKGRSTPFPTSYPTAAPVRNHKNKDNGKVPSPVVTLLPPIIQPTLSPTPLPTTDAPSKAPSARPTRRVTSAPVSDAPVSDAPTQVPSGKLSNAPVVAPVAVPAPTAPVLYEAVPISLFDIHVKTVHGLVEKEVVSVLEEYLLDGLREALAVPVSAVQLNITLYAYNEKGTEAYYRFGGEALVDSTSNVTEASVKPYLEYLMAQTNDIQFSVNNNDELAKHMTTIGEVAMYDGAEGDKPVDDGKDGKATGIKNGGGGRVPLDDEESEGMKSLRRTMVFVTVLLVVLACAILASRMIRSRVMREAQRDMDAKDKNLHDFSDEESAQPVKKAENTTVTVPNFIETFMSVFKKEEKEEKVEQTSADNAEKPIAEEENAKASNLYCELEALSLDTKDSALRL